MNENAIPPNLKERSLRAFGTIAGDYDGIRFVRVCARRLLDLATLRPGARVLDLATGTGFVALAAAEIVGPGGAVVGVDLSPEMLERAEEKRAAAGLANLEFLIGDAERLDLPSSSFDVALCASSLFFVPDMLAALRECRRVLAPGGRIGVSSFGPTHLQPLRSMWYDRLERYGIPPAKIPSHRLADPEVCRVLVAKAGFEAVEVRSEQLGYHLTPEAWWEESLAGLSRMSLIGLDAGQLTRFKAEHLEEVRDVATDSGLWIDVAAYFTFGTKGPGA